MSVLSFTRSLDVSPTRSERRAASADRFLDALEEIVRKHRAQGADSRLDLDAELITGEVAHELAQARAALQRVPHVSR